MDLCTSPLLEFRDGDSGFINWLAAKRIGNGTFFDWALFAVFALTTLVVPENAKAAGNGQLLHLIRASTLFFTLGVILYLPLWSYKYNRIAYWQRALRSPMHAGAHLISAALLATFASLPGTIACSSIWEGYSAFESTLAALVWPAVHLTLASVPLTVMLPIQAATAATVSTGSSWHCTREAAECPRAVEQYDSIYVFLRNIFKSLPFGACIDAPVPFQVACTSVHVFIKVGVVVVISVYVGFALELSSREEYARESGQRSLASELRRRSPALWQLCGEIAVALAVVWHIASAFGEVWLLAPQII